MANQQIEGTFGIGDYEIDIVVYGFPGRSVCHGTLGFSTIALVRWRDRIALIDVGSFGMRYLLKDRLADRGLKPADVTDILLTHSHYDHSVNWPMFKNATIVIGREELEWSLKEPIGETLVPEFYMTELDRWPNLKTAEDEEEVFPGITAHTAAGHTPGSLVFVLDAGEKDVVFTGDACKNRAELKSRVADMSYDPKVSGASIENIWSYWSRRPGSILVPGHDLPMIQKDGDAVYMGKREAAIRAWYGDDLNETTVFSLVPE
ncbi:MAG: MBL fold metallo-hydrolase [Rhodospirillaceae bacterium]